MENNSDFIQILLEKIEKDDLPTNVFDVENTDPLVLLGKMNEIIGQLSNFQSSVNSSNTTANEALSKAEDAVDTSGQALSNANTALSTANLAIGTANTAIGTANQALETAQDISEEAGQTATDAKTIAETANQNSNQAVTTANEAKSTAENALEQVTQGLGTKVKDNSGNLLSETTFVGDNGVNINMQEENQNNFVISLNQTITNQIEQNKNNITQLNNDVSELNQTANTAQSTAETANTNAQNAQSTANTALTTANGAVSKNTEQDNSISALQTADGQNVKLTGDQSVSGIKNFSTMPKISSSPIIESGSNANGYWVRFADGTQICGGEISFKSASTNTVNLPQPFIITDYGVSKTIVTSASSGTYSPRLLGLSNKTTTNFHVYGAIDFSWVAIGRWK